MDAQKKLSKLVKKFPGPEECHFKGCSRDRASSNVNAKWCAYHRDLVAGFRRAVTTVNWRGKTSERAVFNGRPTVWAIFNPKEALREARAKLGSEALSRYEEELNIYS